MSSSLLTSVLRSISRSSVRCFHSTYGLSSNDTKIHKMARNMNKLIHGNSKRKRRHYMSNDSFPTLKSLTSTTGQHGKCANRRIEVLNKLFMRHISDQMATGAFADKILGLSIEISKVKIAPDFRLVNVYWVSKGPVNDVKIQEVLNDIRYSLRHELSQLRLMGEVPVICFVKDREFVKYLEVEESLAAADFGDDFVPTDVSHKIRSEFILNTKLDPEVKEKIKKLEAEDIIEENPIPELADNIFGLNRNAIMQRITDSMNKSKNAWSGNVQSNSNDEVSLPINDQIYNGISDKRQELLNFLESRRINQLKLKKTRSVDRIVEEDEDDIDDTLDFLEFPLDDKYDDYYEDDENINKH